MRLIDADAFKKQIAAMAVAGGYPADKANRLCELIDAQPTVELPYVSELPCTIGDAVYVTMLSGGCTGKVTAFTYSRAYGLAIIVEFNTALRQTIPLSEFGKTVFLTKP